MNLFDVYPLFDIEPIRGEGCHVFDENGKKYLDFYGGHAVISIGHSHPHFVKKMEEQLSKMIFYSNSVQNGLQRELAEKLGKVSKCENYDLFLINSGAEAVENALKVASFKTGKSKIISLKKGFHGRTSAAVNVTDNEKIKAQINKRFESVLIEMNDETALKNELKKGDVAAVIVECIQGVGGLDSVSTSFLKTVETACAEHGAAFIADEIQSGFGRTGKFFAFQHHGVEPDIITMAKGMGNGFPIGGILIKKGAIEPWYGMLGTTFGGNHFACTACLAVLEVFEKENLIENAARVGEYLKNELSKIPEVKATKGKGLMCGAAFDFPIKEMRNQMVYEGHVFTGNAKLPNVLRILPPLNISEKEVDVFIGKLKEALIKI